MAIVLYWFYLLWFGEPDESPFPDIDQAWNEAMKALESVGIRLPKVPVFLVLGRPASEEAHFFEASGIKLALKPSPADPNAPLHVYAEPQAVYVTCRGASVLGELARILALETTQDPGANPEAGMEEEIDDATMKPVSRHQIIIEQLRAMTGRELTTLKKRVMRRTALGKPLGSDFMSNPAEVARLKARLAHLCRLIGRDRQPWCAANGMLLLIPMAGTDTPGEAQLTAQACQEDLNTIRHEIKVDCPHVTALVDFEELPGALDFIQRQSAKELKSRRGSGFPVATRLSREAIVDQVRLSLNWVCTTYLQDSIYKGAFQTETPTNSDMAGAVAANSRLILLLDEMNDRADAVGSIVRQVIAPESDSLFRYAGFYLAATGAKGKQAFVAGILEKLVREQNAVTWTQAAKAEDGQCRAWANYYFLAAWALFLLWGALFGLGHLQDVPLASVTCVTFSARRILRALNGNRKIH